MLKIQIIIFIKFYKLIVIIFFVKMCSFLQNKTINCYSIFWFVHYNQSKNIVICREKIQQNVLINVKIIITITLYKNII